jgi:CheY-like chemotaxis protein
LGKKRQHIKVPLISVVDDDRSVVEAMVSLIQSVGYKAQGFRSAEAFFKSRQLLNTGCLILDVRMPSMGGFELQRRLAAGNYRIPIIFITAYDSDDVHIQGVSSWCCRTFVQTVQPGISVPSCAFCPGESTLTLKTKVNNN